MTDGAINVGDRHQFPPRILHIYGTSKMGSLAELQNMRRAMEDKIIELENRLRDKDDLIQELNSKLDKYQSIVHIPKIPTGPRKQRAQGISAEPQTAKNLLDKFKTYPKSPR